MTPLVWMAGMSLVAWLAVWTLAGSGAHPEALYGMLGPLAGTMATWVAVVRAHRRSPQRVTAVLMIGFAAKMVWYGAYVVVMLLGLDLRVMPFVLSFTGFFIALYAMEALFLRRLMMETPRDAAPSTRP